VLKVQPEIEDQLETPDHQAYLVNQD